MTDRIHFFRTHAPKLIAQGYDIVPIKPGTKRPGRPGWQRVDFSVDFNPRAHTGLGVGVKTKRTPGVDLDTTDEAAVGPGLAHAAYTPSEPQPQFLKKVKAAARGTGGFHLLTISRMQLI
jgi:hypothetical protein